MTTPTEPEALAAFQREERYIVIKRKHLDELEEINLRDWIADNQIAAIECVVVESDWPEYETVWQMIEARSTSTPAARMLAGEGEAAFQQRVQPWMMECFGAEISGDMLERSDRAVEEMLELSQASCAAIGVDFAPRAHALVDYVAGRPVGEIRQEVGGVMVTLAALCLAAKIDMHEAGEIELARILQPHIVEKIRAKQAAKPTGSALPVAHAPAAEPVGLREALEARLRKALPGVWTNFLDANPDELTSPEEYPDHALMTGTQFEEWAMDAFLTAAALATPARTDDAGEREA
jgi:hypothetical protein